MKKIRKYLVVLLALSLLVGFLPQDVSASEAYPRLAGQTRYQTAKAVAESFNSGQVDNVVIATGNGFADALSVSVLAGQRDAPILLANQTTSKSQEALDYISKHMSRGKVWIAGGTGVIDNTFESKLRSMGNSVERIAERDRYGTCLAIAEKVNAPQGTPVFIASGENFPDALSIASVAASRGYPIILSPKNTLPSEVESYLSKQQPSVVFIIGGTGVISPSIESNIKTILPSATVTRIAGQNRFETAAAVYEKFFPCPPQVYIASGMDFADALSASVLAAKDDAPIILINHQNPIWSYSEWYYTNRYYEPDNNSTCDYLLNLGTSNMTIIGGTNAISQPIANNLNIIIKTYLSPSIGVQSDNPEIIDLAKSITKDLTSDYAKVRAVHDWVAKNIAYDIEGYHSGNIICDALGVLHARKGVCQGYACLSAALLRSVGVKTKVVQGIAASGSIPEEIRKNPQAYSPNHAWNEAYADGRWVVFDATWDAGYVDPGVTIFTFCYKTEYWDPDQDAFAKNHLKKGTMYWL